MVVELSWELYALKKGSIMVKAHIRSHTHTEGCIYHAFLVSCVLMFHTVSCMCELVLYFFGGEGLGTPS